MPLLGTHAKKHPKRLFSSLKSRGRRIIRVEEIWRDAALYADVATEIDIDASLLTGRIADVQSIADILETLYHDHIYREAAAEAIFRRATMNAYSWDSIAERGSDLLNEVLDTYLE